MSNKKNNKTQENEFLKKKLKATIITYSIFAIIIFILALLKKYSVISSDFSLILFYFIMAIIAFGIMLVFVLQIEQKVYKRKEPGVSLCLGLIGIFLLVAFGIAIDVRKELIDFSKNATKTEALVYKDVEKDIDYHEERCTIGRERADGCYVGDNRYGKEPAYYDVEFIYHLKYNVEDEIYTSTYRKQEGGEFSSEQMANSWESQYKKGDYITIYYDNDDPTNIRGNFALGFGMVYFFEVIAILFQFYYFIKHRKLMKEVVK